jgi:hypothetical protein
MLMMTSVTFAFLAANAAGCSTRVKHATDHFFIGASATRGNPTRDVADIRAVEVEPNTLFQVAHHFFCETRIST